jgi:hypothetical protein
LTVEEIKQGLSEQYGKNKEDLEHFLRSIEVDGNGVINYLGIFNC